MSSQKFDDFFCQPDKKKCRRPETMGNNDISEKNQHLFFHKQIKHFELVCTKQTKPIRWHSRDSFSLFFCLNKITHSLTRHVSRNTNTLNQMLNKRLNTVIPFKQYTMEKLNARWVGNSIKLKHLVILDWIYEPPTNETESSPSFCRNVTCHFEIVRRHTHARSIHHNTRCDRN